MTILLIPWLERGSRIIEQETGLELLQFDANFDENHEYSKRITTHPVEDGAPISDHIISEQTAVDLLISFVDDPINEVVTGFDRARRKFRELKSIFDAEETFQLVTGLEVYDNVAIERISVPRTNRTGYAVEARVSFKQLSIANQILVTVPPEILSAAQQRKGQGVTDAGQQGTTEATDAEDTSNQTLLLQMVS